MSKNHNIIYVIIDKLTRERYYILYIINNKETSIKNIINIFIKCIFYLYKLLISIISDRGL